MAGRASNRAHLHFENLDGLRFVAFLFVFIAHAFQVPVGSVGVSFFFVLSGFLITYLILAEIERNGTLDVRAFYVRRALRIWPLYYALVVVIFFLYPLVMSRLSDGPHGPRGGLLHYLTFLANFYILETPRDMQSMPAMVMWSVAVEEQFYVVWPLLFRFLPRRLHGWVFLPVIVLSLAFRLTHSGTALEWHTFSVISDMAVGGLAAWGWMTSPRLRDLVRGLPRAAIVAVYAIGIIALAWDDESGYAPVGRIFAALVFAFIIVEQNFSARSFYKMSSAPLLGKMGQFSYGLYMLHAFFVVALWRIFTLSGLDGTSAPWVMVTSVLAFSLSVVAAWLSFRYFETPFLVMKARFVRIDQAARPNRGLRESAADGERVSIRL